LSALINEYFTIKDITQKAQEPLQKTKNEQTLKSLQEEIAKNSYVLTPGRYVGIKEEEDDGVPFKDKMKKLTGELEQYFEESRKLEEQVENNLKNIRI